jgi:hypothetical protein
MADHVRHGQRKPAPALSAPRSAAGRPEDLVRVSTRLLEAIIRRDGPALEELLDPDFVHLDGTGVRTPRAEFIASILSSTYTVLDAGFDSLSVDVVGGLGVVSGVQRAEVALGEGERIVSLGAFTDVFVPTEKGWRIRLARSIDLDG